MFDNIENIKILSSSQGTSKPYSKIQNRKNNMLSVRRSGSVEFDFGDKIFRVSEGEIMFVPQGSSYVFKTVSETASGFISINFSADFADPKPASYSLDGFPESSCISNHFPNMWSIGTQAEKYKCISLFYSLLAYISNIENRNYADKQKFDIIDPAISYLKSHIFDCSLKVDKLHLLCGISDTYFRKIFAARFGTSPQSYIVGKRISQAQSIINSGDFDTISEVAAAVGYSDPLYFSRAFKKKYGISPSNMNKEILN